MKKDLLSLKDYTGDEICALISQAMTIKNEPGQFMGALKGKGLGLLFQKPSSRTRVSFEAGMNQLGGYTVYLAPGDIMFGQREEIKDMARCFAGYLDVVVIRTFADKALEEFALFSNIPVINGLTDCFHPCQALADGLTITELFGKLTGIRFAYIGDGNNVANSLMFLAGKTGMHMTIATPHAYSPDAALLAMAQQEAAVSGGSITIGHDPAAAVQGAQVVYTDVWTSMGKEAEQDVRRRHFAGFQINEKLLSLATPSARVMHCLPAHRGEEITDEIIESDRSVVFQQAANRMHAQKAILVNLMKE